MRIQIDLETEKAKFIHCAGSVGEWNFLKGIVDRILALDENLDEKIAPIDSEKGIKQRDKRRAEMLKEAEAEEEKKKSPTKFPEEMEEFVKNNLSLNNKDLAKKVNIQFDLDLNNKNISDYMRQRKIKRGVKEKLGRPVKKFTPAVDRYIKDHADMPNEELAAVLKRVFKIDTTPGSVGNRRSVIKDKKFERIPKEKESADALDEDIDELDLDN